MSTTETMLNEAGGDARMLWARMVGYPGARLVRDGRVVGEIRQMPDGTGVLHDGRCYTLISPGEMEDLLRRFVCVV